MMVASLCGQSITEEVVAQGSPIFERLSKDSSFTLPALETTEGDVISSTAAICEFLAFSHESLLGKTDFERAQVDQWLSLIREETWPLCKTLSAFVFGGLACDTDEYTHIYNQMKEHIKALNNMMKGRTYLVGDAVTVADLQLVLCVCEMEQMVLDTNFRNSLNNLNAHFKLMAEHPTVRQRCGTLRQGKK